MDLFTKWDCRHTGLFTFSHSAKHLALYQKFAFWPRFLTAIMSKPAASLAGDIDFTRYSRLPAGQKDDVLAGCCELTDQIYEGLDASREIRAVDVQGLGDTILLLSGSRIAGFAVCHVGARTEAGSGACYAKFGAVLPGKDADHTFGQLLGACGKFAANLGVEQFVAGMNTGRHEADRIMLARGFRTAMLGIAMQRGNDVGYNRPGVYLLDDWR
jgi:hypothetical protein